MTNLPPALRGALWMILGSVFFAILSAMVRQISHEIDPIQVAFFRTLGILVIMLVWKRKELKKIKVQQHTLHIFRALFGTAAMLMIFTAFSLMPIADVTALTFTTPLFATVGAAFFLGETLRARRIVATIIGFIGAMIILRPGIQDFDAPALLALGAAVCIAGSMLTIKGLSRTESSNAIVLINALLMTPMCLIPMLFVWTTPSWELLSWLAMSGVVGFGIQQCMTRAFAAAEATAVLPFDFARLLFTALVGFLVFNELPDMWTWIGGAVVMTSVVYIARREALAGQDLLEKSNQKPL
ncbi:MAG: DMT family transporter [Rhodospirillales bacterium]|nr:DMT family transporter [Rhodospirillales bacterium]